MRVLVIGSGAPEHALVARLRSDRPPPDVLCAPGNPGIARLCRVLPFPAATRADIESLVALAEREQVDLIIVGPELPLSLGMGDFAAERGRPLFGPTAAAA